MAITVHRHLYTCLLVWPDYKYIPHKIFLLVFWVGTWVHRGILAFEREREHGN
jgi:hypothetical protein